MKKIIVFVVLFFSAQYSFSQYLERVVIGSLGNYKLNGASSLSYTTGEAVIQTFFNSSNILTQGFQQPVDEPTEIKEIIYPSLEAKVYPNPTSDWIGLEIISTSINNYAN